MIGELALFANQPAAFNLEHQAIAQEVANQLAVEIQQARQREQLQSYATFTNLLTNAIKFVAKGEKPVVRIWTQKHGQWVRLWVEDQGIGIEPKHQKRIFQVFERLHGTEVYPGTGIGLAIVRRGVERMGGQVGVESALAQGSRFWIELPAVEN